MIKSLFNYVIISVLSVLSSVITYMDVNGCLVLFCCIWQNANSTISYMSKMECSATGGLNGCLKCGTISSINGAFVDRVLKFTHVAMITQRFVEFYYVWEGVFGFKLCLYKPLKKITLFDFVDLNHERISWLFLKVLGCTICELAL